jgi:predicted transglutaminase-like cysteine proteinase
MWGKRALLRALGATVAIIGAPALAQYPWHADDALLADAAEFPTWSDALQRNADQQRGFVACLDDKAACQGAEKSLRVVLVKGAELEREDQVRLVHRYVNRRSYKDDRVHKAISTFTDTPTKFRNSWMTLFEFAKRGGDCEDYATAKYFLLRQMGVSADNMRIVITRERRRRAYHAVLAVRQPTGAIWLLESNNVIAKDPHRGYRFVYAVNENSVWDHSGETG